MMVYPTERLAPYVATAAPTGGLFRHRTITMHVTPDQSDWLHTDTATDDDASDYAADRLSPRFWRITR